MVATTERKKVRYFDKETKKLAWAYPEDLPDYAVEATADEPVADEKVNDYSEQIEQWLSELRTAVEDIRVSRDSQQRFNARNRAEQYKMAVDIYRAAEFIPAVATQFGSYRADFHFRVPPKLEEYDDISPLRRGTAHRYITADPVEIAYLRTISDYEEVPVGHVYSRGEGKRDGLWVDLEFYERQRQAGQAV
jgi:hypothetical protein